MILLNCNNKETCRLFFDLIKTYAFEKEINTFVLEDINSHKEYFMHYPSNVFSISEEDNFFINTRFGFESIFQQLNGKTFELKIKEEE